MKYAYISFGTGGTLGHKTLLNKIKESVGEDNINIYSEYYKKNIPSQEHKLSTGGKIKHIASQEILKKCIEDKVSHAIFSTFFDIELIRKLKNNKIKTFLITYPLRDSFAEYNQIKKTYDKFDKVIILEDICPDQFQKYQHVNIYDKQEVVKSKEHILITCGGGGRPSSELFCKVIQKKILPLLKNYKVKIVLGPYNNFEFKGIETIKSQECLDNLYKNSLFVISEAGYYTVQELLTYSLPGFLIPGERRIDNQELRAIYFEKNKFGMCSFYNDTDLEKIFLDFLKNLEKFKPKLKETEVSLMEALE